MTCLTEKDDVGHQEGAAAVLVGQEGESPDIAEPHRVAHTGEHELGSGAPVTPRLVLDHAALANLDTLTPVLQIIVS